MSNFPPIVRKNSDDERRGSLSSSSSVSLTDAEWSEKDVAFQKEMLAKGCLFLFLTYFNSFSFCLEYRMFFFSQDFKSFLRWLTAIAYFGQFPFSCMDTRKTTRTSDEMSWNSWLVNHYIIFLFLSDLSSERNSNVHLVIYRKYVNILFFCK